MTTPTASATVPPLADEPSYQLVLQRLSAVIHPAMPIVVRPPGKVQVGQSEDSAVVFASLDGVIASDLVGILRRSQHVCDPELFETACRKAGLQPEAALELAAALEQLLPRRPIAHASNAPFRVHLHGRGPLAQGISRALAAYPGVIITKSSHRSGFAEHIVEPNLVILSDYLRPDPIVVKQLMAQRIPHLVTHTYDEAGIVGPLVRPGAGCCLYCVDFHRSDIDPAWPIISNQLTSQIGWASTPVTLTTIGAVIAQMEEVLAHHRDPTTSRPPAGAVTYELRVSPMRQGVRRWTPHPRCSCFSTA